MKDQEQSDLVSVIKDPVKIEADFHDTEGNIIGRGKIFCPQGWDREMRIEALSSIVQIENEFGHELDEIQKIRNPSDTINIGVELADKTDNIVGRLVCKLPAASRSDARITFIEAMIEFERAPRKRLDFGDLRFRPALNNTIH